MSVCSKGQLVAIDHLLFCIGIQRLLPPSYEQGRPLGDPSMMWMRWCGLTSAFKTAQILMPFGSLHDGRDSEIYYIVRKWRICGIWFFRTMWLACREVQWGPPMLQHVGCNERYEALCCHPSISNAIEDIQRLSADWVIHEKKQGNVW